MGISKVRPVVMLGWDGMGWHGDLSPSSCVCMINLFVFSVSQTLVCCTTSTTAVFYLVFSLGT